MLPFHLQDATVDFARNLRQSKAKDKKTFERKGSAEEKSQKKREVEFCKKVEAK